MASSAHDEQTATAYHAAAHMAIACHYNLPVGRLSMAGQDTARAPGHTPLPIETDITPGAEPSFHTLNVITCLVAGAIAEERYSGRLNVAAAEGDHQQAWRLAIAVADTDRAAEALLDWLTIRAEQDVNRFWNEITAIAALLLENGSVTPEQARAVARDADRRRSPRGPADEPGHS